MFLDYNNLCAAVFPSSTHALRVPLSFVGSQLVSDFSAVIHSRTWLVNLESAVCFFSIHHTLPCNESVLGQPCHKMVFSSPRRVISSSQQQRVPDLRTQAYRLRHSLARHLFVAIAQKRSYMRTTGASANPLISLFSVSLQELVL